MNWQTRPIEIANLLNPAFYSLILRESSEGFIKKDKTGIPYSLIFLIPPLVLHKKTRNLLPSRRSTTPFGQWLMRNEIVKIGFADRTKQLIPYTKEALLFGIQHGVLEINNKSGNLFPAKKQIKQPASWPSDSIPSECLNKAKLVGQWFAEIGDPATIYRVLGIRP